MRIGNTKLNGLLTGLCVFVLIAGLWRMGLMEFPELAAYDILLKQQPRRTPIRNRMTLITITESDIQELGQWPIPDELLARALENLMRRHPRAVGVDMYRDIPMPPGHEHLTSVLKRHPEIICVMKCGSGHSYGVRGPHCLQGTDQIGFVDMTPDADGMMRRTLLFMDNGKDIFYSFGLRLALAFLTPEGVFSGPCPANPGLFQLGRIAITPFETNDGGYYHADAGGYQTLLDFRDRTEQIPHINISGVLKNVFPSDMVAGRLVLIGVSAESIKDYFYTPIGQISGVTLHALAASQLIAFGMGERKPIRTTTVWMEMIWILFCSLVGGMAGFRADSIRKVTGAALSGIFGIGLISVIAFLQGWWIPPVAPAIAWGLATVITPAFMLGAEKRRRTQIMGLFAAHVSKEFADIICEQPDVVIHEGKAVPRSLDATILFMDIAGFTTTAETMLPETLFSWLNEILGAMTEQIIVHQGVICKFIGDAIMAAFGAPIPRKDLADIQQDAIHAVDAALAMQYRLLQLNHHNKVAQRPIVTMRIGIYTGPVVAGSLGSAHRMEYTLIGDSVNVASRLESFLKDRFVLDPMMTPCRICIGESTWQLVKNEFTTLEMGEIFLKGKKQPVAAYRVTGRK